MISINKSTIDELRDLRKNLIVAESNNDYPAAKRATTRIMDLINDLVVAQITKELTDAFRLHLLSRDSYISEVLRNQTKGESNGT